MATVDMVINTNLQVHKLPFLVAVNPENTERAKDILNRVLNNEVAVFTDVEDVNLVQSIATNTPFIIDKLYNYKAELEEIKQMEENKEIQVTEDEEITTGENTGIKTHRSTKQPGRMMRVWRGIETALESRQTRSPQKQQQSGLKARQPMPLLFPP